MTPANNYGGGEGCIKLQMITTLQWWLQTYRMTVPYPKTCAFLSSFEQVAEQVNELWWCLGVHKRKVCQYTLFMCLSIRRLSCLVYSSPISSFLACRFQCCLSTDQPQCYGFSYQLVFDIEHLIDWMFQVEHELVNKSRYRKVAAQNTQLYRCCACFSLSLEHTYSPCTGEREFICFKQCCFLSQNIGWLTPKIIYFHYLQKSFLEQSIQLLFYFILKTEALVSRRL